MKITNFSLTIEVSKDKDGYSNNYYVNIDESGVNVSQPYIKQIPEQVMLAHNLINTFIANSINFNSRVNIFNKEMGLEEYAPKVVETEEPVSETIEESAESQSLRGGSEEIDNCPPSMEDAKEEVIIATVRGSSNEGLTVIGEELEARETSSDNT